MVISFNHAAQKFIMFIVIFTKRLFVVFIIKELKSKSIEMCNMLINWPRWWLFVRFGVIPVAVFLGLRIGIIANIKNRRQICCFSVNVRCYIGFIIWICCWISSGNGVFMIAMTIKMNRMVQVVIWISMPDRMIRAVMLWQCFWRFTWQTNRVTPCDVNVWFPRGMDIIVDSIVAVNTRTRRGGKRGTCMACVHDITKNHRRRKGNLQKRIPMNPVSGATGHNRANVNI